MNIHLVFKLVIQGFLGMHVGIHIYVVLNTCSRVLKYVYLHVHQCPWFFDGSTVHAAL